MQAISLRKAINTLHLWLGFISGIILLVVAITGGILAFEDEIRNLTEHDLLYVEAQQKPKESVQHLLEAVREYNPKAMVTQVRYFGDPEKAAQVYTKDKKIYAVNPYTDQVLGVRDQEKNFMFLVLSLHRTLFLGHVGEEIIFWNACVFLVILLSGLFLWWPRRRKQFRQAVTIKKNASVKRRYFDLHSVAGFYVFIPMMFVVVTGIDMAAGGSSAPKKKSNVTEGIAFAASNYDSALHQSYHGEPVESIRITIPKDSNDVIGVSIRYETSSLRKQTAFVYDRYSVRPLSSDKWQDKTFRQRFFGSDYEIHTGRILGLPGKLVMFLAALITASLPVTGFLIWNGKRRKKRTGLKSGSPA
ncbi:MAG: hypothetical protein DI535_00330 [Citrobacter freundii]|nr:MAG: hypothetical protein DI535_00330 [Citrobacter freundii]